jgi:hypothetical protein
MQALKDSTFSSSKIQRLWTDIGLLARLRVAFLKFLETALSLSSFSNVAIILVPRLLPPVRSAQRHLNLNQTLEVLGLKMNDETVKKLIGPKSNVSSAKTKFSRLQKQERMVHAEVQMLLFLSKTRAASVFPYFGCSKLGCFMCFHLLQGYGKYGMRGCHGRFFKPWTIPNSGDLQSGGRDRIVAAIRSL